MSAPSAPSKCARCGGPLSAAATAFVPFCSSRCKLIDLSKWLSGSYRIPGPPVDSMDPGENDTDRTEGRREGPELEA